MNTCIIENPSPNNLPALRQRDQRAPAFTLALALLERRHRVRGPVARVVAELAQIGREARQ